MKTLLATLLALGIGVTGGYFLFGGAQVPAGTHVMPDGSTMSDTMAGMTGELEGKTGEAFDRAFIEGMIVHHEGAVEMAEQALERAFRPEIKEMAADIIEVQTREIAMMQKWLKDWYETL
jgi:uncharacterized protein (DUF305 family)